MLVVAGLVVVFVWVLPQFIDYDDVWSALKQLDAWELAALVVLALARVPTEALIYRAFLPGLRLTRGSEAYLSSNLAGQLLPPPSASLIQYGYFRDGGYEADAAEIAAFGSFVFPTLGRFLLPLIALLVLLVTGDADGTILLAGALSLAITSAACVAGWFFLRRESTARRLGAKAQRPLSWILLKLKREPIADGAEPGQRIATADARRPAQGLAAGLRRRRGEPLPHLPDPARVAPLRRRLERATDGA